MLKTGGRQVQSVVGVATEGTVTRLHHKLINFYSVIPLFRYSVFRVLQIPEASGRVGLTTLPLSLPGS